MGIFRKLFGKKDVDPFTQIFNETMTRVEEERIQTSSKAQARGLSASDVEGFFTALHECNLGHVRFLLLNKRGLATFSDAMGSNALHELVKFHRDYSMQLEIAKLLLDAGVDANSKDNYGATPLHGAVACGNIQLVRLLISHGANVRNTNINGAGPIHHAYSSDMLTLLLQNGADINARRNDGTTLLDLWLKGHMESDEFSKFIMSRGGIR
jgi:ankyrin repeat protein